MALHAKPLKIVAAMNATQRTAYFEKYARYFVDSPDKCYAIRIGSTTLHSADTLELRQQFDTLLNTEGA